MLLFWCSVGLLSPRYFRMMFQAFIRYSYSKTLQESHLDINIRKFFKHDFFFFSLYHCVSPLLMKCHMRKFFKTKSWINPCLFQRILFITFKVNLITFVANFLFFFFFFTIRKLRVGNISKLQSLMELYFPPTIMLTSLQEIKKQGLSNLYASFLNES